MSNSPSQTLNDRSTRFSQFLSMGFNSVSNLIHHTFVLMYPSEINSLARRSDIDSELAERFELYINGIEKANGFSELNDPAEQATRFHEQVEIIHDDYNEAMHFDEEYIDALKVGLPPTGGMGLGIDKLVMMVTGAESIRDGILFPHMRPERSQISWQTSLANPRRSSTIKL